MIREIKEDICKLRSYVMGCNLQINAYPSEWVDIHFLNNHWTKESEENEIRNN